MSPPAANTPPEQLLDVRDLTVSYETGRLQWRRRSTNAAGLLVEHRLRGREVPPGHRPRGAHDPHDRHRQPADPRGAGSEPRRHRGDALLPRQHAQRLGHQGRLEADRRAVFNEVEVDRFLLEDDDDRSGGFEPLRLVPPGKTVVLGLVSSKTPELESQDELRRRNDEAAKHVPLDQLAISPQCGFASTKLGNLLTADDQRRKLELVARAARAVWG